jgi:hypothetical protein
MRSPAGATPIRPLHPGRPERIGRTARTDLAGLAGFAPLGDGPLGRAGRAARLGLLATLATLPALAAASATTLATLPALAAASATTLPRAAPGSAAAPAPPAVPIGCCSLAGTTTRLELDGFVQVYGAYFHEQSLNDNGALLAFDHALDLRATPGRQFTATARTTRLGLSAITPTASLGDVLARIEIDFADGKGFGGKPHLRHAYLGFGNWIAGHTWSVWTDPDAAGETVDNCGAVGQACFDTGRYTQLRYTVPMGHGSRLAVSVEKNVTTHGVFPDQSLTRPASPAGTIPDGRYPSLVAAYTMDGDWGHLSLRGLEQHYGAYTPGTAATDQLRTSRWAGAWQMSGALNVGNDKLVASYYTGQALGPYGIGWQAVQYDQQAGQVQLSRNSGWQAGYTRNWSPRFRSNLVAGGVYFKNDSTGPASIKNAHSYFVNTFAKLAPNLEAGLEYGYEDLQTFGQAVTRRDSSMTDRNHNNKVQISLTAKF